MRSISQIFLVFWVSACAHQQSARVQSSWHALSKAKKMSCTSWPLREKDLKIEVVRPLSGSPAGVFVTVMKRDASPDYYFSPVSEDGAVDSNRLTSLVLPQHGLLAGGFRAGGKVHALVVTSPENAPILEIRQLESNVVLQRFPLGIKGVEEAYTHAGPHGEWLVVSTVEGPFHLYFLHHSVHGAAELRDLGITFQEPPHVASGPGGTLVVWHDAKSRSSLRGLWLETEDVLKRRAGVQADLALGDQNDLESWQAGATPEGFYLAIVTGDSLLGEADLKVAKMEIGSQFGQFEWVGQAPLRDIHAAEPYVVKTAHGTEVLLPNWVDEESTIARYNVTDENLGRPIFSGLFPRGTRIMDSLEDSASGRIWALTRHRIDSRWVYQICGL